MRYFIKPRDSKNAPVVIEANDRFDALEKYCGIKKRYLKITLLNSILEIKKMKKYKIKIKGKDDIDIIEAENEAQAKLIYCEKHKKNEKAFMIGSLLQVEEEQSFT